MRCYMIFCLLWFGSGLAYPRIESKNQAVYEVQEDKDTNTLKFMNPESKKPILREITYFHVVEKAYDGSSIPLESIKDVKDTIDSEQEVKTERPFTNGHGYQFIDYFPIVINDTKLSDADDLVKWIFSDNEEDDKGANGNEDIDDDDDADGDEEYYEDVETDTGEIEEDSKIAEDAKFAVVTEKVKMEPANTVENASAFTKQKPIHILRDNESTQTNPDKLTVGNNELNKDNVTTISDKNNEIELVTEEIPINTAVKVEATRRTTRHRQLFDSPEKLNERYRKMKNFVKVNEPAPHGRESEEETNGRRKRTARLDMPEAPTLPELNYDGLPDFIKSIHFTERPSEKKKQGSNDERYYNGEEHLKEEIKKKMEHMFDNISPGDSAGQRDKITHLNGKENVAHTSNNEVGTYGMKLTGNNGYVWNNLQSNSGPTVNRGELENVENSKDTKSEKKKQRSDNEHHNNGDEHLKEEIRKKMEHMFVNISPGDSAAQKDKITHLNGKKNVADTPNNEVGTYGMKLTGNSGYVWNNLQSIFGPTVNRGELKNVEISKETKANKEESTPHKLHTTPKPSILKENKPEYIEIKKERVNASFSDCEKTEEVGENDGKHYNIEQEKLEEEIKRKLEDIFDNINTEDTEREDEIEHENAEDSVVNIPTNKDMKYGMNLMDGHGYVWNDLPGNPGLRYNVGEIETVEVPKETKTHRKESKNSEIETTTRHEQKPSKHYTTQKPRTYENQKPVHINIPKDRVDTSSGEFERIKEVGKNEEKHYNDQQEEIKRKLEDMFDSINPEDSEKEVVIEHMNTEDGVVNIPTNKVRTYGMTLTGDHGVVWNDLWSNPATRYYVGNVETVEESKEIEANKEESENPEPERTTTHKPHTTAKPSIHEEQNPVHHNYRPNSYEEPDDIFVNIDKDENKKEPHTVQTLPNKKPEKEPQLQTPEIEESSEVSRPAIDDTKEELKPLDEEDREIDKEKIPQTLNDLINNEQLWKWLSDWTETYMSLLTEHILKVVKEEISKQMENSIKENITLDHSNEKQEIKKDDATEEIQNKKEEVHDKVGLEKQSDGAVDEKNDDKDIKNSEKETIFVDGVEYPLTNTSNIVDKKKLNDDDEDSLRNRKNKDDKKEVEVPKKKEVNKEVKVVAQNIYGNSLEADKVTNMFFFFDPDHLNKALEIIKPLLNQKNGSSSENIIMDNKIEDPSITEDKPKPENPENLITDEKIVEVIQPNSEQVNENENSKETKDKPSLVEKEPSTSEDKPKPESLENLITEQKNVEAIQPNSAQVNENENSKETKDKPSLVEKEPSTSDDNKKEEKELVINTTENSKDERPLINENSEIEAAVSKEIDDKIIESTTEDSISKPVDENDGEDKETSDGSENNETPSSPSTDEKDTNKESKS